MEIRTATIDDAKDLLDIYAPYVEKTAVSFEYTTPTVSEFKNRIKNVLAEYPYLVAIMEHQIVGYAYASSFHSREAYKHSAEVSIYIKQDCRRNGIGRALYTELEQILKKQNVYTLCACIAVPDSVDEHLNNDSERFHKKMGYKTVGKHAFCGFKFNKWYSMIWMEKDIAKKDNNPGEFISFPTLL